MKPSFLLRTAAITAATNRTVANISYADNQRPSNGGLRKLYTNSATTQKSVKSSKIIIKIIKDH